MKSNKMRWLSGSVLLLATLPALTYASAQAQNASRTFPETGKTVTGRFLDYWNTHGGLAQQGFPISDVLYEISETNGKTYSMQYFERAEFELHPENAAPNDVLLSLLGVFLYNQKYPTPGGAPNQATNGDLGAYRFPETGKTVGGLFLKYWNEHGGLAQQGYPISEEFVEVSPLDARPYKVQYFQRAVFEYHPESAPPNDVLLSQLGTFRYREVNGGGPGPQPNPTTTPAPGAPPAATPIPPTATYTPEPTATEANTPRPAKTSTPVPTTCPTLNLSMSCRTEAGDTVIEAIWDVTGGGGEIQGTLTTRVDNGPTFRDSVSGRSGHDAYALSCSFYGFPTGVSFLLELHDECGQSVSGTCGGSILSEPCP